MGTAKDLAYHHEVAHNPRHQDIPFELLDDEKERRDQEGFLETVLREEGYRRRRDHPERR